MKKFKPYVVKSNNQTWLEEINDDYTRMGYYTELKPGVLKVYSTRPAKPTKKKEKDDDDDTER